MQTTQQQYRTETAILAAAVELAGASWKVALDDGRRRQPRLVRCDAEQLCVRFDELLAEIDQARTRWDLGTTVRVVVGYEAGQDGFWLARALEEAGLEAIVIDPASVPVERHRRRRKTDRLDALKLSVALRRWLRGEWDAMRAVRVPDRSLEDERWQVRDRQQLQKECRQHRDRIVKLLRTQGCQAPVNAGFGRRLSAGEIRDWRGAPLGPGLQARLAREWERLKVAEEQLKGCEAGLRAGEQIEPGRRARIDQLQTLKSIGPIGAQVLVLELYWRSFDNRREVGSCAGLVGQPFDSGESRVDQGISKQGRSALRALLVELAWLWLRYQPDSELSRWFRQRTASQGKRVRRIMIVALARKLAIALWRYLETGEVPAGAQMKAT